MLYENDTHGFTLYVEGPDSIEDFDREFGTPGAALRSAVQREIYHRWNKPFAENLVKLLEEKTGQTIPSSGEKKTVGRGADKKEVDVPVSAQKFLNKLLADRVITEAEAKEIALAAAKATGRLDLSPSVSDSVSKGLLEQAESYLRLVAAGQASEETFRAQFAERNGLNFSDLGDGSFTAPNIAMAIKINEDRKKREAAAKKAQGNVLD